MYNREVFLLLCKEKTICFTGHRKIRKKDSNLISIICTVVEKLIMQGYCYFVAGGARGFDTLVAQVVLEKKKEISAHTFDFGIAFC